MSRIRRLIPVVASVSLTAACNGDGNGDSGRTTADVRSPGEDASPTQLARAKCEKQWPCDPEYYVDEFDDVDGCAEYYASMLDAAAADSGCEDAFRAYMDCFIQKATCEPYTVDGESGWEAEAYDACESEYETLESACASIDLY